MTRARGVAAVGILTAAAFKVAGGASAWLGGFVDPAEYPGAFPPWVHAAHVIIFSGAGLLLITGGRSDVRPARLGALFLLLAASFSDRLLAAVAASAASGTTAAAVASVFAALQPEAFVPFVAWRFVKEFPRVEGGEVFHRAIVVGTVLSLTAGCALFVANLFLNSPVRDAAPPELAAILAPFGRVPRETSSFWHVLILLEVPAFLLMLRKIPMSARAERRRVGLFVTGLVGGAAPMMIAVILESLSPRFAAFMEAPGPRKWSGIVCYSMLLSVPLTTGYAVLVGRVMDVRLVVRQAIRYSLARGTILVALLVPLIGVVHAIYERRDRTISELLAGRDALALAGVTLLCIVLFRARSGIFDALDRHFFREQYDARQLLASIADRARHDEDVAAFAGFVESEIDRALHVQRIAFLVAEPNLELLTCPLGTLRPLPLSPAFVALLSGDTTPMELDPGLEPTALRGLSQVERDWVAASNVHMLVPLIGSGGTLVGAIALGRRKSEQPFSPGDRLLLSTVAAAVALAIENRALRSRGTPMPGEHVRVQPAPLEEITAAQSAGQCQICGLLHPSGVTRCQECMGHLVPSLLPLRLNGKFHVHRLIGTGGMGIVYFASDAGLDRPVALKTLPRISPDRVRRLRREARAMASLQHPHLALIYGLETWNDMPVLVVEYFQHGTLADRLRRSRLSVREVCELGVAMAAALHYLHKHKLLHRDIKPSNIGLTSEDVPKLLDFGLARVIGRSVPALPENVDSTATQVTTGPGDFNLTLSHEIVGTVAYLSPEAVGQQPPSTGFDLWSLSVTLYEALTGVQPFKRASVRETVTEIVTREAPDVRVVRPDCPAALAALLAACLSHDSRRRPASAQVMAEELSGLLAGSGATEV